MSMCDIMGYTAGTRMARRLHRMPDSFAWQAFAWYVDE
jgi:hypothetical protein